MTFTHFLTGVTFIAIAVSFAAALDTQDPADKNTPHRATVNELAAAIAVWTVVIDCAACGIWILTH